MGTLRTPGLYFLLLLATSAYTFGRDFPQAFEVTDPLYGTEAGDGTLLPRTHAEITYNNHLFMSGKDDSFNVSGMASFTLLDLDSVFALNLYWGTYLLVGPIAADETPATVAEWWMNALQFEYGIVSAWNFSGTHLSLEYARTSQHPWRPAFSQVTTDALRVGVTRGGLRSGNFSFDFRITAGYIDLFDFWQSSVPKPRTQWVASPAIRTVYRLIPGLSLFGKLQLDALVLREGGHDADMWAEVGIEAGRGAGRLQFYLDYYHSNDSEGLEQGPSPATLFGLGFRLYG